MLRTSLYERSLTLSCPRKPKTPPAQNPKLSVPETDPVSSKKQKFCFSKRLHTRLKLAKKLIFDVILHFQANITNLKSLRSLKSSKMTQKRQVLAKIVVFRSFAKPARCLIVLISLLRSLCVPVCLQRPPSSRYSHFCNVHFSSISKQESGAYFGTSILNKHRFCRSVGKNIFHQRAIPGQKGLKNRYSTSILTPERP